MDSADNAESELDALYTVTQRLVDAEAEGEICEVAVSAIPDVFGDVFGGLWLYDAEATELQLTAETEGSKRLLDGDVVYRPGNSISWEAFEAGEMRQYPGTNAAGNEYNADSRINSELILPLGDHGVLNIASEAADAFTEREVRVARILAANIESALSRAQREHALRVQNDRLEEFVGMVSHDLRNPLTVADGHLELARETDSDGHLDSAADALNRIDTLIEDLLTLAEQGYVVESRTRLDLRTLAETAWSNVHTPDATLQTDGTVDIFGDESRLLQVFENLFRNSVEHGSADNRPDADDAGERADTDVTIRVGPLESLHTSTRVSAAEYSDGFYVADDGPGIPDTDQSLVFESGHSTAGTGLGLAIVQRIVDAHGWDITAGESVQRGARFEVHGEAKPVTPFENG